MRLRGCELAEGEALLRGRAGFKLDPEARVLAGGWGGFSRPSWLMPRCRVAPRTESEHAQGLSPQGPQPSPRRLGGSSVPRAQGGPLVLCERTQQFWVLLYVKKLHLLQPPRK